MRRDPIARAKALADGTPILALWRGKPLIAGDPADGGVALAWLPKGHPVLASSGPDLVFLGIDNGTPRFAADISGWVPDDVDEAQVGAFLDATVQVHPAAPRFAFRELRSIMTGLTPRDAELAATARAVMNWHKTHGFCSRCGAQSVMVDAGWQRSCPVCAAHHFPRTDPVVIMLITHGDKVLLGRSPGWPDRMFSLLAGFVEPGETVEAAVRREVFEETAVRVGAVTYLASQPWPYPASLMLGCRGEAISTDITVDPTEIEDALWLDRSAVLEVFAGTHPRVAPARSGAIAHFLLENWLADRLD